MVDNPGCPAHIIDPYRAALEALGSDEAPGPLPQGTCIVEDEQNNGRSSELTQNLTIPSCAGHCALVEMAEGGQF